VRIPVVPTVVITLLLIALIVVTACDELQESITPGVSSAPATPIPSVLAPVSASDSLVAAKATTTVRATLSPTPALTAPGMGSPTQTPPAPPTGAIASGPIPTWTLPSLVDRAAGIAEVQPVPSHPAKATSWVQAHVVRWLKRPDYLEGFGKDAILPLETTALDTIGIFVAPAERARLTDGADRYLLFLKTGTPTGGWCAAFPDFYTLLDGAAGIFPIRPGRMVTPERPWINGQRSDRFGAQVGALVPTDPGPTPAPAATFASLVARARRAQYIADVAIGGTYGSGGNRFYEVKVRKWYKKPPDFAGDRLTMSGDTCGARRAELGSEHYIVFLPIEDDWQESIYGVSGSQIDFGGLGRYWGWTLARFEDELQAAITTTP